MEAFGATRRNWVHGLVTSTHKPKVKDYIPPVVPEFKDNVNSFLGTKYRMVKSRRPYSSKRKRRGRGRRRYRIGRTLQPSSIVRKLKSSMFFALNPAAGAISTLYCHLNSAYDPMGSISGTRQPLGFDQYMALYNRYTVIGWKVTLEAVSTDNTNPLVIGFTPSVTSTALTTVYHYKELPGTVQRILTPDIDKTALATKGSVKRWLCPSGGKLVTEADYSGTASTDPSRILSGHFYAQAMDESADPANVNFVVTLTQIVVFHNPITPSRSTQ